MQFNQGDKVLIVDSQRGLERMSKLIGTVKTIERAYTNLYVLEGDAYLWKEEWLQLYQPEININESDWHKILGE